MRPLLSALTKLDLIVAVAPDNPNLSTWFRSGGLPNNQRYPHPRLLHRHLLQLSVAGKVFKAPDKSTQPRYGPQSKKPIGERALGLVAAWEPAQTGHLSFDEARSPMGLRVRFCELQRVTKPLMGTSISNRGTRCNSLVH